MLTIPDLAAKGLMALSLMEYFELILVILGKVEDPTTVVGVIVERVFETEDEGLIFDFIEVLFKLKSSDLLYRAVSLLLSFDFQVDERRKALLLKIANFYIKEKLFVYTGAKYQALSILVREFDLDISGLLPNAVSRFVSELLATKREANVELAFYLIKRHGLKDQFPIETLITSLFWT